MEFGEPKFEKKPAQPSAEEIANKEKSRTISDAELLKGGAELEPTAEQIEVAREEMETALKMSEVIEPKISPESQESQMERVKKAVSNAWYGFLDSGSRDETETGNEIIRSYTMREFVRKHPKEAQEYSDYYQKKFGAPDPSLLEAMEEVRELQKKPPEIPPENPKYSELSYYIQRDPEYIKLYESLSQAISGSDDSRLFIFASNGVNSLEELTEKNFREKFSEKAALYDEREKTRVHRDPDGVINVDRDPTLRSILSGSKMFHYNFPRSSGYRYRPLEEFIRNYPEKAKGYAEKYAEIREAVEGLSKETSITTPAAETEGLTKENESITAEKSEKAPAAKVEKEKIELSGVVLPEPIMNIAPADVRQLVREASKPGFYEASTPEKQKQIRKAEGWVIQYNDQRSKWYQEYEKRPKDDFIGWLAGEHGIGQEAAAGIYKELAARTPEQIAENLASSYWLKRLIKERGDTAQYVGGKDFDIARSEAYLKNIKEGRFFDSAEIDGLSGGELTHATEKSAYNFFKGIADNTEKYIEMFKDSPELVEKGKRDGEEALRIIKAMERAMADRVKQFPNADKIIAADIKSGDLEIINKYQRQGEELFEKGVPATLMTPEEKRVYYDAQSRRDGFVSWLTDQYGVEKSAATEIYKELAARSEKSPQESVVETPARKEKLVSQQEKERLIRQEKEKILQERINGLFKEFDSLRVRDFESIFQTGKTAEGKRMKSKSMGRLNPETAKALAKAFREGIKLLPEIIKALPKLLKNLDKDLTKEASKRVEKKSEQEKKKAEKQPKKEIKPELKPKEKPAAAEVKK